MVKACQSYRGHSFSWWGQGKKLDSKFACILTFSSLILGKANILTVHTVQRVRELSLFSCAYWYVPSALSWSHKERRGRRKHVGQGFSIIFPCGPQRAEDSFKIDVWGQMIIIVLCYFYVYWGWQRAKQVWSAGRIWPKGRHLRRPDVGYD